MASNARNLSKLLGTSTQVPTTALPPAIADLEIVGETLSGGEIAPSSIKSNTLTQSFDSNQAVTFNMADSIDAVSPIVSVFKEVPQAGFSSKGRWDVNANATNYDFYDEKPISYSSSTLTPSATGDGTFTSSTATSSTYDISSLSLNNTFDISTVSITANGVWFKSDGTVMYIHDNQVDTIIQYPLSTAWDLSTVGSTTGNVAVGSQDTNLRGPAFSADGTKMYHVGYSNDRYYQYTLSTAWDVTSASYSNKSVSFASVDAGSSLMHWKSDGTSFFSVGSVNDTVYRWDLTTAWDISTASNVSNFSVSSVFNIPYGVSLNSDGTKMFIMGRTVNSDYELRQYSLSTAYDITTASYDSVLWDWVSDGGQSGAADGHVFFGSSGTRLYLVRSANNVTEWISGSITAFSSTDVGKKVVGNSGSAIITSTAGAYKSVTAFADTSAISSWQLFGAEGKSDGSGIQLSGFEINDTYNLSSPSYVGEYLWNNTAAYPTEIGFSTDGTKCFYLRNSNDSVYHATLSTPFDISTLNNVLAYSVTGHNQNPRGIWVKEDGMSFMVVGTSSDRVFQWNLSSAWDLSSGVSVVSTSLYVGNQASSPNSMDFNSDGTKLYVIDYSGNIYQYGLTAGFNISTASYDSVTSGQLSTTDCMGMRFNSDGTKIFIQRAAGPVETYNLSPAYDITSATLDSGATWTTGLTGVWGISFSPSGHYVYLGDNSNTSYPRFKQYTSGTGVSYTYSYSTYSPALTNSSNGQINSSSWQDINSMTADETKNGGDIFYAVSTDNRTSWSVAKGSDGVRKIAKNNSGTWQYNNDGGSVVGYGLANETYDNKNFDTTADTSEEAERGIAVSSDGTKFYITGYQQQRVWQFDMSTPFDLSTGVYNNVSYALTGLTHPWGLFFKPDGTKMYVLNPQSTATISEYALSTAWDVSTASHTATENYPAGPAYESYGLFFKSDGSKVYILRYNSTIYSWNLTTPWDITTGSYIGVTSAFLNSNSGRDILFNDDGLKMYLLLYDGSPNTYYIREYDLSTAWDPSTASYNNISFQPGLDLGGSSTTITAMCWANSGKKLYVTKSKSSGGSNYGANSFTTTTTGFGTSETWVNGTTNNEYATLQQALTSQAFNRMNKAQLDAVADGYHFSQDSADTLDLMIAPYAASGTSPISDGVTINYDAEAIVREAIPGTDYIADFPNPTTLNITAVGAANLKIRAQ